MVNFLHKEFKTTVLKMLKELKEDVDKNIITKIKLTRVIQKQI